MTPTTNRPATEPALIDTDAVAQLLGCSARHVVRLRDGGLMPPGLKLGRLHKWPRAVIADWIAGGCRPVAPAAAKA